MANFKLIEFDRNDPKNQGRPNFFDLETFLSLVEQYITADEVSKALWLLDNMPGWYRDNVPAECIMLRDQLLKRFFTTLDYGRDGCTIAEVAAQPVEQLQAAASLERGWLTLETVKGFNSGTKCPWIFELGPGNYWIPFMLSAHQAEFTYYAPSLNKQMQKDAAEHMPGHWAGEPAGQPKVFICFEMIEHLENPAEIFHHYIKAGGDFDVILLSTPKYTFGGGMPNWFQCDLGHLRTYTPREFLAFAQKHWPRHDWAFYDGPVMCLKGVKKDE